MRAKRFLWLAIIHGWLGCQTPDQQVGSVCPAGNCLLAEPTDELACLITQGRTQIDPTDRDECLPRAIPVDAHGLVACHLSWEQPHDAPGPRFGLLGVKDCSEPPFVDSTGEGCVMRQLSAAEAAAGELAGWSYSDDEDCPRLRYSPGVPLAQPGATARLTCATALARPGEAVIAVHPSQCAGPSSNPNARRVGASCLPTIIPDGGFIGREAYVESPHAQCGTGACVAFKLEGDPSPQCSGANCATEQDIQDRLYCSCRCDASGDDPSPECECPDSYSCVEQIGSGFISRGRHGYCVDTLRATDPALR